MKPTDPTPEEYVKWIMDEMQNKFFVTLDLSITKFILTELRDNSTTEEKTVYFNECLTELKKL